jgi:hypothetical protein
LANSGGHEDGDRLSSSHSCRIANSPAQHDTRVRRAEQSARGLSWVLTGNFGSIEPARPVKP